MIHKQAIHRALKPIRHSWKGGETRIEHLLDEKKKSVLFLNKGIKCRYIEMHMTHILESRSLEKEKKKPYKVK